MFSAEQGALTHALAAQQGFITEEGYKTQASAYRKMVDASRLEADAQDHAATGATWGAAIKGATAVASLFTGGGGIGPRTFSGNDMFCFSEDPDSLAQSLRGGGFGGGVFR